MDEIDFAALLNDAEELAWVIASFDGECGTCGDPIEMDDEIRSLGNGEWERRLCCG